MKLLAVDYGTKKIGLAWADSENRVSLPLAELRVESEAEALRKLSRFIKEQGVQRLVLGLPLSFQLQETRMSREVRAFAQQLAKQTGTELEFVNEVLTSDLAKRLSVNPKSKNNSLAAKIILDDYLTHKMTPDSEKTEPEKTIFLSVIIPVFNEEKNIGATLADIFAYLQKQSYSFEVILVNDGSRDRTANIIKEFQLEHPQLVFFDNKVNRGKGKVVAQGMLAAKGELAVFLDADNSTKLGEIEKTLPEFNRGVGVVVGSRRIKGARIVIRQPFYRELLGRVFNLLVRFLFCLPQTDTQAGFKVFSRRARELIFKKQKILGWAFDVELLVIARQHKLVVAEIPISWENEKNTHVKLAGMIKMFKELLIIKLNQLKGGYQNHAQDSCF